LQPNTNTSPRKRSWCSLWYILDSQVDYPLGRQDEIGDFAYCVCNLGRPGNFLPALFNQLLHIYLPLGRVFKFGWNFIGTRSRDFRSFSHENFFQGFHVRSDKLCSIFIVLETVVGGIPESLRRRKDRNLLLCGLCCGLRPFGPGFDGQDRRRYMCLRIDNGRRFRGLSEGGRRSWVVRLFSSRVCVSSSRLSISGRRFGRRSMWFRRVAGNFRAVFYISLFGRLDLR